MAIKQILETCLASVEQEKNKAIATAKEKATREKVIPNNQAIDAARTEAINALTTKFNEEMARRQEAFNVEKASIFEASEKKKSEFAEATLEAESSLVSMEYDKHIEKIKKQIAEIKG